ncbi:clan AA aspartic protease [Caldichromatium japonicum]|uniref:Clan AA aspartic protease n=1 Tax=Caldichromatium japonicum TaxID=2699430 RepID=A0A6G7VBJ8_9GAMM|nr:retropepsin-like aspartic protease [Caldichromatium japonicum]QIK37246.1 clan AA aspartic protease [Caldichromatium japonicum]
MPTVLALFPLLFVGLTGLALAQPTTSVPRIEVAAELKRLSAEFGFAMRGVERTEGMTARAGDGPLADRLRLLLEDCDHVIVQRPDGGIERVIILGEKGVYVPPPATSNGSKPASSDIIVLVTQRQGSSHLVTLGLEGLGSSPPIQETMLLDTGAERVVLPASLISGLGLTPETLTAQTVQTANGLVDALIGRIPAVWVGPKRVEDVEVAFIDDQRLGGTALAGMSLLGRFQMTIDDAKNQLTLVPR